MSWDYAELSKKAKAVGGPEKLIEKIEESARSEGRREGQLLMLPIAALALFIPYIYKKTYGYFKGKKTIQSAEVEEAKTELIQGIKDYDKSCEENLNDVAELE